MKRLISIMLTFALCLSMAACGTADTSPAADSQPPSVSEPAASDSTTPDVSEPEPERPDTSEQAPSVEPPVTEEPQPSEEPTVEPEPEPTPEPSEEPTVEPEPEPAPEPSEEPSAEPEPPENIHPEPVKPVNPTPDPEPSKPEPVKPEPEHKHEYTSKVVAPTCDKDGYTEHVCSCGDSYKDSTVKASGHNYSEKVVAPTTSEKGYTQYTCSKCGHSYKDNYTDKLPVEEKPADGGYTVTPEKVGTSNVDVQDPNNLVGNPNDGYWYNIQQAPEGVVLVHDDLEKVGSADANMQHFADVMSEIYKGLDIQGNRWYTKNGHDGGEYRISNGNYMLEYEAFAWAGKTNRVGRTIMLNAMMYFGGDSMGKAVWSMMVDYYMYTGWEDMEHSSPVTSELAAKYGLTIDEYQVSGEAVKVHKAYVSNGSETWSITYNSPNEYYRGALVVEIPV